MSTQPWLTRLRHRFRTMGFWATTKYLLFTVLLERESFAFDYVFSAMPREAPEPSGELVFSVVESSGGMPGADRQALREYGGERFVRQVDDALSDGQRCIIAHVGAKFAGMVWITHTDRYAPAGGGPATMIERCITLPGHRGRGIYPAGLRQSLQYLSRGEARESPVYIECSFANAPSVSGILKAGFTKIGLLVTIGRRKWFFRSISVKRAS
jgi:hypothetical protein